MRRRQLKVSSPNSGKPLADFLSAELGLPLVSSRQMIETGAVYLQGKRCTRADCRVKVDETITVVLEESGVSTTSLSAPQTELPWAVLYEDEWLIAVNKPAGMVAQPTEGRVGDSLLDSVSRYLKTPAGLVHRLDRETTGVTVFGKSDIATSHLALQFRESLTQKQYVAVTAAGIPESGEIDLPIAKDPTRPGRYRALRGAMGKPAFTRFQREKFAREVAWVRLFPKTGRTHQLRAHLTAIGFPIVGDKLYAGPSAAWGMSAQRCWLHAEVLSFTHPHHLKPLEVTAPLAADMQAVRDAIWNVS